MTALPTNAPAPAHTYLPYPTHPSYSLKSGPNVNEVTIGQWRIVATKKPILNGKEIDSAEKSLNLPLPEMTFGNNSLSLVYDPSASSIPSTQEESAPAEWHVAGDQVELRFATLDALAGVAVGEGWEERKGGGVLVSMAEKWGKNRSWADDKTASPTTALFDVPVPSKPVKPHDWTYSTCYAGSVAGPSQFKPSPTHSLPLPLLARQDPVLDRILFYEDVSLYEDELHDNGESILNVRIRVMPHSFFILARLFVRVDNVLFRMYDVRIYHAFGSGEVIREVSGMEAGYEEIKQNLEKPTDLSPLTSPNWVYGVMTSLSQLPVRPAVHRRTSSASNRSGKPWPGLGKKVEVLKLPKVSGDVDKVGERLESVRI